MFLFNVSLTHVELSFKAFYKQKKNILHKQVCFLTQSPYSILYFIV